MAHGQRKGWWEKNWSWVVGCGCLTLVVIPAGCIGVGVWSARSWMDSAGFADEAVARLKAHPAVVRELGEPLETSWRGFTGNFGDVSTEGETASADYAVDGPQGSGVLHVEALELGDEWTIRELTLKLDETGERLDLLAEPESAAESP